MPQRERSEVAKSRTRGVSIREVDEDNAERIISLGLASNFSDATRRGIALLRLVADRVGTTMAITL